MREPMSPATIAIVKTTAPTIRKNEIAITTRMYERLFRSPEMEALFESARNQPGGPPIRLVAAILAFAQSADKPRQCCRASILINYGEITNKMG